MRQLVYLLLGAIFGVILYKAEVISWFRIQEMFRFQGFHMYGVLFSAVVVGGVSIQLMRRAGGRSSTGEKIDVPYKKYQRGNWIGGALFGTGWALTGACPGPLYAHVGAGTSVMIVALMSAVVGAWVYGFLKPKLPH